MTAPADLADGSIVELFADTPVVCEPYDNGFDPRCFEWVDSAPRHQVREGDGLWLNGEFYPDWYKDPKYPAAYEE